jgi:predicted transcriptional regulator
MTKLKEELGKENARLMDELRSEGAGAGTTNPKAPQSPALEMHNPSPVERLKLSNKVIRHQRAQALKVLRAVGVEKFLTMTLQEIGQELGVSRERVRQIITDNLVLGIMRGVKEERRAQIPPETQAVMDRLVNGESVHSAIEAHGLGRSTIYEQAKRKPEVARALEEAREVRQRASNEKMEERIGRVVDYAKANKVSFLAACLGVGESYDWLIKRSKKSLGKYQEDQEATDILNPKARIERECAVARQRILAGASFSESCVGLMTNSQTLGRRLKSDPVVAHSTRQRTG